MTSFILLAIIYAVFTAVGLPTTLLGTAWPQMSVELDAPLYFAGVFQMAITAATVAASLLTSRMVRRTGPGAAVAMAVACIACGLAGFGLSPALPPLFVFAALIGCGTGALDTGVNNFVAVNYKMRAMNFLHCFFGVGAGFSPFVMSYFIARGSGAASGGTPDGGAPNGAWRSGYLVVAAICGAMTVLLLASLPLWKKAAAARVTASSAENTKTASLSIFATAAIPGVKGTAGCFCALGGIMGLVQVYGASYLVMHRRLPAGAAARYVSLFFIFITVCRFLLGLFGGRLSNAVLIRAAFAVCIAGAACIFLPGMAFFTAGFVLLGFGAAPIIPALSHESPRRFGVENSQSVMGLLFASHYLGAFIFPMLCGLALTRLGMTLYPFMLLFFALLMIVSLWSFLTAPKPQGDKF